MTFVSVVPSPYQRDLFRAIHALESCELTVYYLEAAAPDSPWALAELEPWENVLPGVCLGRGRVRSHVNWKIPKLQDQDFVVINAALTDVTTQRLLRQIRSRASQAKCLFWGELMRCRDGWAGKLQRFLAKPIANMDGIVTIGNVASKDYRSRFPGQPIHMLPYFCDLSRFAEAADRSFASTGNRKDPTRFLFCGQMIHRKGIDLLLRAFSKLVSGGSDARLQLVGREAQLQEFMPEVASEVKPQIEFLGFKSVDDLPQIFADNDVFLLPSRHDGWGVVINQAIGSGLAVVSTDRVGAAVDLIENGVNGLVIKADDPMSLFQAMHSLDAAPDRVNEMQQENLRRRADLSPNHGARRWIKIFNGTGQ